MVTLDETRILIVIKALGDANRLRIVRTLAREGQLSCGEVAESLDIGQPTVSYHLRILHESGLVDVERVGQYAWLTLNQDILGWFRKEFGRATGSNRRTG